MGKVLADDGGSAWKRGWLVGLSWSCDACVPSHSTALSARCHVCPSRARLGGRLVVVVVVVVAVVVVVGGGGMHARIILTIRV